MSNWVIKLIGIAIIAVFIIIALRRISPDISVLLRIICGVVLASACIMGLDPVLEFIREVLSLSEISDSGMNSIYLLLKVLCVAILTHVCSTVCRDCGESSIAYYAELGGKIEMLILSLPLFKEIMDMAISLLNMS